MVETGHSERSPERAGGPVTVRPVRAGEGLQLRELRLRALRDSPHAFASSHESELAHPDSYWSELALASATAQDLVVLVALQDRRWIAMAAARWFDRAAGIAALWGMWVQPQARGRGIGRALVSGVGTWAAARGAGVLRLGVTDPAAEVAAFYERLGFERTGETKQLPPDGAVRAFFLARSL